MKKQSTVRKHPKKSKSSSRHPKEKAAVHTPEPAKKTIHKDDKKKVLFKGSLLHLMSYTAIGLLLNLLGVPLVINVTIILVLVWGLFVLGYAYYFHK